MPLQSETVALPLVKGLDVTTDARLLQAPSLLEAQNTQFAGGGAKKRRGHTALMVRGEGDLLVDSAPNPAQPWTYGIGYSSAFRTVLDDRQWDNGNPQAYTLSGVATRDDETLMWDGFRLYSYLPSQLGTQAPMAAEVTGAACMPSLHAVPMAKVNEHQGLPEMADNGTTRIVAWVNNAARYAIYDSTSNAQIASGSFAVTTPTYLRAFTLGTWMHVMVLDGDDDNLKLFSISSSDPNDITYRSYGPATHFDLWKHSNTEMLLARTTPDGIDVSWISTIGGGSPSRSSFTYVPTVGHTTRTLVSVSINEAETALTLAWYCPSTPSIGIASMSVFGGVTAAEVVTSNVTGVIRLTLATKRMTTGNANYPNDLYWDNGTDLRSLRFALNATNVAFEYGTQIVRYRQRIASRAWRVGDRTFLWAGHVSTLQATWLLLDEQLLPVGHMDFGVADVTGLGTSGHVGSVNWNGTSGYLGFEFHTALNYKLRVTPNDSAQATAAIYTEPSIKGVYLDYLPPLRSAQAGRTTYFTGAQLWAYDGQELVEAGFHTGPEPTIAASNGGNLTASGTYNYRVDLCHRNAQNEEVRSLSLLTNSLTLAGAQKTITLTIPTVVTRRTGSYFLIYRNAMEGGVPLVSWWLLNSRDPEDASYLPNDLTQSTLTVVDAGTVDDTAIQTRELHPATDTYLQPIAAPACEIIASGRDRLWVGGGELPLGVVAPSRLFDPGEVPSFNAYLNIQVDRSPEPLTALGFIGEVACLFRKSATHILDSDGPDNVASGLWNPPRLALSDLGAVSQESLARITQGLIFQSPAGFRLLGPGGALSPIGMDIDADIKTFDVVGTLVSERDQEVRFYGADSTYVFNYLYGTWAKWTCGGVGVAKSADGYALLAREDGDLWIETPGVWSDGTSTYSHRIRTGWLHGGNLGDFQRVRRVGGLGRYADSTLPGHTLRVELYYDEREFWEERIEWTLPDTSTNQDTWGEATWGAGVWGDTSATISNLEDLTWEWVRRTSRQKCSVFSVSLEDVDTDGPGFILSAFTFELARKPGLNRTPERTGTGTYRT